MKKTGFIIGVMLLLILINVDAQYRVNKKLYDSHNYSFHRGDPHNPAEAGFFSILIPGLGQTICGEVLRGAGFLSGCAGSLAVSAAGIGYCGSVNESDQSFWRRQSIGKGMIVAGLVGTAAFWGWSIADAAEVAKINNLAWRDKLIKSYNIQLQPYIDQSNFDLSGRKDKK